MFGFLFFILKHQFIWKWVLTWLKNKIQENTHSKSSMQTTSKQPVAILWKYWHFLVGFLFEQLNVKRVI